VAGGVAERGRDREGGGEEGEGRKEEKRKEEEEWASRAKNTTIGLESIEPAFVAFALFEYTSKYTLVAIPDSCFAPINCESTSSRIGPISSPCCATSNTYDSAYSTACCTVSFAIASLP